MNANYKKNCNFGANCLIDNDRVFLHNYIFTLRYNHFTDVHSIGSAALGVGIGVRI